MRNTFKTSLPRPRSRPAGLTLIEAVLGVAVLGTILVATLMGRSALLAQARRADNLSRAAQMADRMLEEFWKDKAKFPLDASGSVPDQPAWRWRTSRVQNQSDALTEAHAQVVALEILEPESKTDKPAIRVEVVLPSPEARP